MSPTPTTTTAPISWSTWRVQSMPLVSLTPIQVATAFPRTLPIMPKMIVSQSGICCLPGRIAFGRTGIAAGWRNVRIRRAPVSNAPGAGRSVGAAGPGPGKVGGDVVRKQSGAEVFRITGARQGLADDVRGRQRRYVISMSVRTVSVVAAALLWNVERHIAFVALGLALTLFPVSGCAGARLRPRWAQAQEKLRSIMKFQCTAAGCA